MSYKSSSNSYIDIIGEYFDKLPSLPRGAKEAIVSIVPVLALIFGVIGVAISILGIIFPSFFAGDGIFTWFKLLSAVFLVMGFSGTQKRQQSGWKWIFYSELVNIIKDILTLSLAGIVLSLIGFYFLYQIRKFYK